ncbi:hypothetical protein L798_13533 [Zootermopsis nevadensis]|uniref:Uncharacterized protein n=1 Tax=Zootermopsis nevadensis TaxID=136037 RepID=A0A067QRT5_ZOONE|nr:hypothetical protein L798_13533 [Zootermopsis nevadensis]
MEGRCVSKCIVSAVQALQWNNNSSAVTRKHSRFFTIAVQFISSFNIAHNEIRTEVKEEESKWKRKEELRDEAKEEYKRCLRRMKKIETRRRDIKNSTTH